MKKLLDHEITPKRVREIRADKGLTQSDFWGAIGVTQSTGCKYETGAPMPDPVRRLLAVHYLADIPTDAQADDLVRLGALARAGATAERNLIRAKTLLDAAGLKLGSALTAIRK